MSSVSQATDLLYQMVRRQGQDILKLPSSVKMYLNQDLAPFPEEKAVLIAAVDAGVLDQLRNPPDRDNIEAFYHVIASRFSKSAGVHPEWARWAVNVWSEVLSDVPKLMPISQSISAKRSRNERGNQ